MTDKRDLWGGLSFQHQEWSPIASLREQAELLEEKTKGAVVARLRETTSRVPTLFPDPPKQSVLDYIAQIQKALEPPPRSSSPLSIVQDISSELEGLNVNAEIKKVDFQLNVPSRDYTYHLFSVEYGLDFFPLVIKSRSLEIYEVVTNSNECETFFIKIFQHQKTIALVTALYNSASHGRLKTPSEDESSNDNSLEPDEA